MLLPVFASVCALLILFPAVCAAVTLVVAKGSKLATVSAALAVAKDGDEICIRSGLYEESNLRITKAVTIRGIGKVEINAWGKAAIFLVESNGVAIRDLTLAETGSSNVEDRAAVKLLHVRHCMIENITVRKAFFGIYLSHSAQCVVRNCRVLGDAQSESSSGNGIHTWYSDSLTIENNSINKHRDGVYLEFTKHTLVRGNTSTNNLRYGLHFMFSDYDSFEKNVFTHNGSGVAVMYTRHVTMRDNTFSNNWGGASYGLLLKEIFDSVIEGNLFETNTVGITAEGGGRLTVRNNVFRSNGWALRLMANCMDNFFTQNAFYMNSFDVSTNSTQNFSSFLHNYWDAYRGYDLDHDGVGDVPFRPVRIFSYVVEKNPPAIILLNSFIVSLMDLTERVFPTITPSALADAEPVMHPSRLQKQKARASLH
jgi:nitrous oxidase accessory protein